MKSNILVTGATGFIGRSVIDRLVNDKYRITALVRDKNKARSLWGEKVTLICGDVTDTHLIETIPDDFSHIVHAAAAVSYRMPKKDEFYRVNVEGTKHILAVAAKQKCLTKFVYVSSVGVYGPIASPPADETTPHNPVNDYEISKDRAEQSVINQSKNFPTVIIQPTLVYGPGDTASGMHGFFQAVLKGLFINIWGNKTQLHPCFIGNLIDALMLSLHTPVKSQTFIISDPKPYELPELVDLVKKTAGKILFTPSIPLACMQMLGHMGNAVRSLGLPSPISSDTVKFMIEHRAYDISKAQSLLNFSPCSTEHGIKQTLAYLRHAK